MAAPPPSHIQIQALTVELGKSLNRVEDLRLIADYKGEPLDHSFAEWAVEQASQFVSAMGTTFEID